MMAGRLLTPRRPLRQTDEQTYRGTMRVLAVMLALFALLLFREVLRQLNINS